MRINVSKLLGIKALGPLQSARPSEAVRPASYESAGYASIPYERAPQVMDTVPTKNLLPGYDTPTRVWTA